MEEVINKHEANGEYTGIYAQIENGKLTITEQDIGELEREYSRDGEVESFVFFDVTNTNRLKRAQWKFSGDKHKSLQVYTERTFHQRYLLVML